MTSIPSSSFLIGRALKELTVSTIEMTSGNSLTTAISGGDVGHAAARGLIVDDRDRVVGAGRELLAKGGRIDGLAPLELEGPGGLAAAQGDVVPLVREGAVHAVQDLLFDDVADRALHDAPGAAGHRKTGSFV